MILAYCHKCGATFRSVFEQFGIQNAAAGSISNCAENCPYCGGPAEVRNTSFLEGQGFSYGGNSPKAEVAFFVFQRRASERLANLNVSRQQARRFVRTLEKKPQALIRVAYEIGPEVAETVKEAEKTSNPTSALKWLAGFIVAAATTYAGVTTGIDSHLSILERLDADTETQNQDSQINSDSHIGTSQEETDLIPEEEIDGGKGPNLEHPDRNSDGTIDT